MNGGHGLPSGRIELAFNCAKFFTLVRTTAIPRSSEAFNSKTLSLNESPNSCRAAAKIVLVFPVPIIINNPIVTCFQAKELRILPGGP